MLCGHPCRQDWPSVRRAIAHCTGAPGRIPATSAHAGRGLALRVDHGTQYTADDFLNQVRFWGIAPSFAFVAEPQTNGVAERFTCNNVLTEKCDRPLFAKDNFRAESNGDPKAQNTHQCSEFFFMFRPDDQVLLTSAQT